MRCIGRVTRVVAVMLTIAVSGCATESRNTPASKPDGPPSVLGVTASEFQFQLSSSVVRGGPVRIDFANKGQLEHMMITDRLKTGRTRADVTAPLLRDGGADIDAVLDQFVGESDIGYPHVVSPGMKTSVTLPLLTSGTYVMVCYFRSPGSDATPHFAKGMVASFEVAVARPPSPPPFATSRISMSESGIRGVESLSSGRGTVRVANDGSFAHSLQIVRLYRTATLDEAMQYFRRSLTAGPEKDPPAAIAGGVSELGYGQHAFFNAQLPPGRYVALDLAPSGDGESAPPFYALKPTLFQIPFTVT